MGSTRRSRRGPPGWRGAAGVWESTGWGVASGLVPPRLLSRQRGPLSAGFALGRGAPAWCWPRGRSVGFGWVWLWGVGSGVWLGLVAGGGSCDCEVVGFEPFVVLSADGYEVVDVGSAVVAVPLLDVV